tara:strand:+ start:37032 stop:37853 length:822 start_codon:yes stop_codon:yes gene_type:complete
MFLVQLEKNTDKMNVSLKGKKVLVGGSTRGIGLAIARQLASSGATVCLMARDQLKMKKIIGQLSNNLNQEHSFLKVDFSDFESFKHITEDFFNKNKIDILVNNTQGPSSGNSLSKSVDDYQIAFDLLFKNIVYLSSKAIENMKKQNWGRIINVASVSVREPLNYLVLSNSMRSALVSWSKTLSTDVANYGITVNSILTGYFDTERIAELIADKAKSLDIDESEVLNSMKEAVPLKRLGKPEEYGYLVNFLASDKASYITGCSIPIDGGLLKSV